MMQLGTLQSLGFIGWPSHVTSPKGQLLDEDGEIPSQRRKLQFKRKFQIKIYSFRYELCIMYVEFTIRGGLGSQTGRGKNIQAALLIIAA